MLIIQLFLSTRGLFLQANSSFITKCPARSDCLILRKHQIQKIKTNLMLMFTRIIASGNLPFVAQTQRVRFLVLFTILQRDVMAIFRPCCHWFQSANSERIQGFPEKFSPDKSVAVAIPVNEVSNAKDLPLVWDRINKLGVSLNTLIVPTPPQMGCSFNPLFPHPIPPTHTRT